jgi:hypothetical protein
MFCRRCGAELPEGAAACPRCQEPVLLPGMPGGFASPGFQPPAGMAAPPAGQWPSPAQAGQPFPPAGEQFSPPPPWTPPIIPAGWPTGAGPGGPMQPPPPARPLLEPIFGPAPRPGMVLAHTTGVQRRFLSRLQPTTAGSAWFGALGGALISFVLTLFLAIICSLLLGGILDQAFASTAAALNLLSGAPGSSGASGESISFFSNPLILFDYVHRSAFTLKLGVNLSGTAGNLSASITPPATLLLLIPAIGLLSGGYFAASTDYTGRRLFSITRGASVCLVYALLALALSLFTSIDLLPTSSASSPSLTLAPDPLSVFLNSLFWGLVFGTLGGALRARSLPAAASGPLTRRNTRLRAAWLGARFSLTTFFAICLALVLALYLLAQLGGPSLHTEGSPIPTGSSSPSTCHIFLQQPTTAPATAPFSDASSGVSGPVWFLVDSPPLAAWLMTVSLGAPLQISGDGLAASLNSSIGLLGADCGPGPQGTLLYFLLVIPAIAIFLGGRRTARAASDSTAGEAAGTGLMLAGMLAIGMVVLAFLTSITVSVLGISINFGPSLFGSFIAALIYGVLFGVPGAIMGRTSAPPQPAPFAYAAWPMGPGAATPVGQAPQPPSVSMAVASVHQGAAGMPSSITPAGGVAPDNSSLYDAPTRLSGPLDLHHAPTLVSEGAAPPQTPPSFPGSAGTWHAPTQPPGSGTLPDGNTQAAYPGERPAPLPPPNQEPADQ